MKKELTKKQKEIRTCNMGTMTPSMKHSMIKASLRKLSMFWKPIHECKKNAKLDRRTVHTGIYYHSPVKSEPMRELDYVMMNFYRCNSCKKDVPEKTFTFTEKYINNKLLGNVKTFEIKLKNNVDVDHIDPVVTIGNKVNWHSVIEKLLDEDLNNYQLLCRECHKDITNKENKER